MKQTLTFLYNLFASMNPAVKSVLAVGTVALGVNSYMQTLWTELFQKVDGIAASSFGNADFSPCGFINYCFPLDTLCTFLSAYCVLTVVCAAVRIVKSFIPSIA